MRPRPRSSDAWSRSTSFTGMPALAKDMAMPPPIVPAPTMVALAIGRRAVSAGTSGIVHTAASAGLTCPSAAVFSVSVILGPKYSEAAGDVFLHDLVGPAIDLLHTGIGPQGRDRIFGHVAVAAEQLQAFVDDLA